MKIKTRINYQTIKAVGELMEKTEVEYFVKYLVEFFLYVQDKLECQQEQDILEEELEHEENSKSTQEEEYISLAEFFLKTRICAQNTIARLLSENEELYRTCAKFENAKYLVKPTALLNYLAVYGSDKLKKRIRIYFLSEESKIFPKCYC